MNKREALKLLEKSIIDVQEKFKESPYCFLSEDDFKCHIYARILGELGDRFSIHTETSFRDGNSKLSKKPDLSIYVKKGIKREQEKFFWEVFADDVLAIVEIKFFKAHSKKNEELAMKDIEKLESLLEMNPTAKGYFVAFSFPKLNMDIIKKRCKSIRGKFYYCSFLTT
ncbi:hypothetical protein [Candidatus Uabimicrobium amorphum]|uniref:Uncharacterized protein n=1 Tax=Uabimicrobium amorphum TaxID=2596890 RepID=A0A5S9ISK5_UABAM|nr:hypothetical protein [Candidatus Uabimicrobium amorphum]BBM86651.1 hypothetical protein UABAM_05037 [Candidatus Uabimicrobium amorphum]